MTVSSNPNYSQDRIFDKFMELYDLDELKKLLDEMIPDSGLKSLINFKNKDEISKDDLCKDLLELIGDNFLRILPDSNKTHLAFLRLSLIEHACKKNNIEPQDVIDEFNDEHAYQAETLEQLCYQTTFKDKPKWKYYITEQFLDIPESVIFQKKQIAQEEETTTLRKRPKLKPLHDYQYQSVNKIINMLSNKHESQKAVFINLPTGAGKTRLTVEAIIEWLNLRNQNKLTDAHEQQKNGKIIFWFASTIELCGQAADEFTRIFESIGIGTQVHLTRLYGGGRRKLNDIVNDFEGIHIVVTNTEHFNDELRYAYRKNKGKKYLIDKFYDDSYFEKLRQKTMCVVVDEAHEITSESYKRFLAAMGFDNSGTKASKINFSRDNVILIGLSATAYKGSGLEVIFECEDDNCVYTSTDPNQLNLHVKRTGHSTSLTYDDDTTPEILKNFNVGTKKIFSMFQNNIFVPLPHGDMVISKPVAIIDVPSTCVVGEHLKFSGLDSFDRSSDLKFRWEIRKTSLEDQPVIRDDSYFSYPFKSSGQYTVKLKVTSLSDETKYDEQTISIFVKDIGKTFQGTIEDNAKFYEILTERKILCPITHGVIIGPRVTIDEETKKAIKKSGYDQESNAAIIKDLKYNRNIIELVKKCMMQYGRKKILIFANSVEHATQLSQIIKINYKRDFDINPAVVTGTTRPGQRRKIIQDFKDGTINVLVNFGVLTTGFDVPEIDTVIVSRLVLSNSLMTQMIGRGQRGTASRGSENLWLFTSSFLENTNHIKLGWEVTAEQWNPFTKEIKDDLQVTSSTSKQSSSSNHIPKKKAPQFILDAKELKFQCTQCKRQVKGIEKIQSFFGVSFHTSAQFVTFVNSGEFRTTTLDAKCKFCRDQNKIMLNCKCEFTNNFSKIHNFQQPAILIAKGALSILDSNSEPKQFQFLNIFETLQIKQKQLIDIQSKLDGYLFSVKTLTFTKISEPNVLRQLINLIMSQEDYVQNTSSLKLDKSTIDTPENPADTPENPADTPENPAYVHDEAQKLFYEIKNIFGHYPTSRQFKKLIKFDDSKFDFEKFYGNKFELLLSDLKINIGDDVDLQNLLFDEFFEKCLDERKMISPTELDEHGQFKIEDYKEIFVSYHTFTSSIQKVLHKVLTIPIDDSISLKEILNDYSEICNIKSSIALTFDDIYMYSKIGIEKYIQKQIPFSLIPLLYDNINTYSEKELESFLILLSHFFKLRNILGSIPLDHVFLRSMDTNTKKFYQQKFSTIDQFFNHIQINPNLDIFTKQKQRIEKYVIMYMDKMNESSNGNQKIILQKIINHVISKSDYTSNNLSKPELELCFQIDNFIENENLLNNYL